MPTYHEKKVELDRVLAELESRDLVRQRALLAVLGARALEPRNTRLEAREVDARLEVAFPDVEVANLRDVRISLQELLKTIYQIDPRTEADQVSLWVPGGRGYICEFGYAPLRDENGQLIYADTGELAADFWRRLAHGELLGTTPLRERKVTVVFSNELPERLPENLAPLAVHDLGVWSGTGEVMAASRLSHIAQKADLQVEFIPSRFVKNDDPRLKRGIVVFLGSALSMQILRQNDAIPLATPRRFVFDWKNGSHEGEIRHITDVVPPRAYLPGSPDRDYAVVAVLPSVDKRPVVFAAGISTHGTRMAAAFLTSDTRHSAQMQKIRTEVDRLTRLKPFEVRFGVDIGVEHHLIIDPDLELHDYVV